ncbi:MAG: SPOR domain-containing protein [Galactobacter sp.]
MAAVPDAHEGDYWYNVETGEVEVGAQSDWKRLLGPYPSREAAQAALSKVESNNADWDDEDE